MLEIDRHAGMLRPAKGRHARPEFTFQDMGGKVAGLPRAAGGLLLVPVHRIGWFRGFSGGDRGGVDRGSKQLGQILAAEGCGKRFKGSHRNGRARA